MKSNGISKVNSKETPVPSLNSNKSNEIYNQIEEEQQQTGEPEGNHLTFELINKRISFSEQAYNLKGYHDIDPR